MSILVNMFLQFFLCAQCSWFIFNGFFSLRSRQANSRSSLSLCTSKFNPPVSLLTPQQTTCYTQIIPSKLLSSHSLIYSRSQTQKALSGNQQSSITKSTSKIILPPLLIIESYSLITISSIDTCCHNYPSEITLSVNHTYLPILPSLSSHSFFKPTT